MTETPETIERKLFEAAELVVQAFEPFGRILRIEYADNGSLTVELDPVSHVVETARPNASETYVTGRGRVMAATLERRGFARSTTITLIVGEDPPVGAVEVI